MKNLFGQPLARRAGVEVRLETDMATFKSDEPEFIADLARVLKIHPEDIRKIRVLRGCVRFIMDIPKEAASGLKRSIDRKEISDDLQEFFAKHNIDPREVRFDVTEEAPFVKRINRLAEELKRVGRTLTWLHLSDVHFIDKPGALRWNQDFIKDDLVKSLPKLLSTWDLNPDLVFFTGDIAFSAQAQQYEIAKSFFAELKNVLKKEVRLYIIPGNHDVSWGRVGKTDESLSERLASRFDVTSFLLDEIHEKQRKKAFERFLDYEAFARNQFSHQPLSDEGYYYTDHFDHAGIKVGVAGLNSAWRSTKKSGKTKSDPDLNELILGEPQIMTAVKNLESCQLRFALLHHPPASVWFKDFDRQMHGVFLPKFDFVLRGHEHNASATADTDIFSEDEYVHIASGALYDSSEYKGKTGYPICFNAVRLNLDTGKGILFGWRYFTDYYKWARDIIAEDGVKVFDLPAGVLKRIKRLPPNNHSPNARAAGAGSK